MMHVYTRLVIFTWTVVATDLHAMPLDKGYPKERPARSHPAPNESEIQVYPNQLKQTIEGIGFEIQSDSIASGNEGLPEKTTSVPHDLVPEERQRFYREMLHGFRYCRLAGGLYWRGLDPEQKHLKPRWPEQLEELREMIATSGVQGVSLEYWSPAPYWKANRKYTGNDGTENTLRCFGSGFDRDPEYHGEVDRFLKDFSDAYRIDLQTLHDHGIPIAMWGLQNEPLANTHYSTCVYSPAQYVRTFLAVAPAVRSFDPKIRIIADTSFGWDFAMIRPVLDNPRTQSLVDALVIHHIGSDSNVVHPPPEPSGKPRFQNEYEYQSATSAARCLNTVQHVMNWFQLGEAPTWFWIHALKPYTNAEASGYCLGFWRPIDDLDDTKYPPGLKPGHWIWNPYNWNAVGSFVRHMPWNCRAVSISEKNPDDDLRVLVFQKPDGKLTLVFSNRCGSEHTFKVHLGVSRTFLGVRYTPDQAGQNTEGVALGEKRGGDLALTLPDLSWEFWEQK